MQKIKILSNINDENHKNRQKFMLELLSFFDAITLKKLFYSIMSVYFVFIVIFDKLYNSNNIILKKFKKYIKDCKKAVRYDRKKIYNKNPYIAICISVFNKENHIEDNILSIINQSFQDFEIIIVNDKSLDENEKIIKKYQLEDDRIKLISHRNNYGVYRSRMESILNAKSKFILLMEPDGMYLNENLLKELYIYNQKNNIEIIEFSTYQQFENGNKIYFPLNDYELHFHKFNQNIIFQPELSEILYFNPKTKEHSGIICRNIYNKLILRNLLIQTYIYIGNEYFNDFIIYADERIINIIAYQFAKNYSNLYLPGYLSTIKKTFLFKRHVEKNEIEIRALNFLLYLKLFYKYLHDFNKDINILYYEMKDLYQSISHINESNIIKYKLIDTQFLKSLLKDKHISEEFKTYLKKVF